MQHALYKAVRYGESAVSCLGIGIPSGYVYVSSDICKALKRVQPYRLQPVRYSGRSPGLLHASDSTRLCRLHSGRAEFGESSRSKIILPRWCLSMLGRALGHGLAAPCVASSVSPPLAEASAPIKSHSISCHDQRAHKVLCAPTHSPKPLTPLQPRNILAYTPQNRRTALRTARHGHDHATWVQRCSDINASIMRKLHHWPRHSRSCRNLLVTPTIFVGATSCCVRSTSPPLFMQKPLDHRSFALEDGLGKRL